MIFKIAWRNLLEYRSRTLIIGVMVALGVTLLVVGNSLIESITRGMEASYRENFTGDLIVRGESDEEVSFIGGLGATPPALTDYPALKEQVDGMAGVARSAPILSGSASVAAEEENLAFAFLWGIQPSSYFALFPDRFTLTEGRALRDGETGIMLSQAVVDDIRDEHGITIGAGDTVLLSGQNNTTGTRIREVTVRGVGAFENAAGILDSLSLVDAGTLRSLTGLTAARNAEPAPAESAATEPAAAGSAAAPSDDELFGDSLFTDAETTGEAVDYDNILGDTSVRDRLLALDNDAWHFLLLDTEDDRVSADVTAQLGASNPNYVVEDWRWGAGVIADLATNIRTVINAVIGVIAVVILIIITNTLVISVSERLGEIGTIRAMGGQKGFVRRMIVTEVLSITLLFGLVGMAAGALSVGVLNAVGIPASNLFLQILFGGPVLKPVLSILSLLVAVVAVAVIGVLASLYPTSVALRVSPVQAMSKR